MHILQIEWGDQTQLRWLDNKCQQLRQQKRFQRQNRRSINRSSANRRQITNVEFGSRCKVNALQSRQNMVEAEKRTLVLKLVKKYFPSGLEEAAIASVGKETERNIWPTVHSLNWPCAFIGARPIHVQKSCSWMLDYLMIRGFGPHLPQCMSVRLRLP